MISDNPFLSVIPQDYERIVTVVLEMELDQDFERSMLN